MTDYDAENDPRWAEGEFQRLLLEQQTQGQPFRVALVARGYNDAFEPAAWDVFSWLLASPVLATSTTLHKIGSGSGSEPGFGARSGSLPAVGPDVYLLFNCANRTDLTSFLVEIAAVAQGIILVEPEDHLLASAEATSAELRTVATTWMRFQLHARLISAPTISALHGGTLPATRLAHDLLTSLARL